MQLKFLSHYSELKFLIGFVLIYGLLQGLYFLIPWQLLQDKLYYHGIVSVSSNIINFISAEETTAAQNKLSSSKAILAIVRGCDGSGSLFLLSAAIIAFSTTWKHKLIGLVASFVLLYVVNQIRVIGLYFVVAYQRDMFIIIHTYIAPTLVIAICGLFFLWWIYYAQRPKPALPPNSLPT